MNAIVERAIGFLLYDGIQALDLTGPMDAFGLANDVAREAGQRAPYTLATFALTTDPVRAETGLLLTPDAPLAAAPAIDTLIVPGGRGARAVGENAEIVEWLRGRRGTRRLASVCTGAFLLADAGLLDGRRVTTHWHYGEELARRHPGLALETRALHVVDGNIHTSGGLTAGIDLALSMIEADLGAELAARVARFLVVYLRRPGNQSQYSVPLAGQLRGAGRLAGLTEWLLARLHRELSVDTMADAVAMSVRNFQRVVREQYGMGPARYLQKLRVERAAVLLTTSDRSIKQIAADTGFSGPDVLRRAFQAEFGVAPTAYRSRFG